jgi:hypothetical protein
MNKHIYDLGINSELRKLTEGSIMVAATQISGEDPAGKTTIELAKRQSLANRVISGSQRQAIIFAKAVAAQAGFYSVVTIEASGSLTYTGTGTLDSDLDFTVSSVWDDIAGITFADTQ